MTSGLKGSDWRLGTLVEMAVAQVQEYDANHPHAVQDLPRWLLFGTLREGRWSKKEDGLMESEEFLRGFTEAH